MILGFKGDSYSLSIWFSHPPSFSPFPGTE